jgi:uncharacterized protein YggE
MRQGSESGVHVQETEPDASYGLGSRQPRDSKMRTSYWPWLARLTIPVFFVLLVAASVAAAQAGEMTISASATSPVIATTGRGEVHVAPDQARLQIAVETRSSSASTAAADNATRLTRTIAAVRAAGIDSAQISTAGYSVATDYDGKGRPSGFVVRNGLRIEVRRIADVGKIIDAALGAGATQVSGVQFFRSNLQDSRRSALSLAVAEARRDAEVLAGAAGGTLGKLIFLTSGFAQLPTNFEYNTARITSGTITPTPIMPGELTVAAVANARWQFLPRQAP